MSFFVRRKFWEKEEEEKKRSFFLSNDENEGEKWQSARERASFLSYTLSLQRVDQILLHANPSESERIYAREFVSLKKTRRERERERDPNKRRKSQYEWMALREEKRTNKNAATYFIWKFN